MNWAEPIAYGALNLKPREFEELQPHEFYKLMDGYKWRKQEQEALFAYFVLPIVNSQGTLKHPIEMKHLLDPLQPDQKRLKKQQDAEYLKKVFNLKDCP